MDTPEDFENCVVINTTFTPVEGGVLDCNANARNDYMESLYTSLHPRGRLHDTVLDANPDTIIDKLDESVSDAEFETRYEVKNLTERCVSSGFFYPQYRALHLLFSCMIISLHLLCFISCVLEVLLESIMK